MCVAWCGVCVWCGVARSKPPGVDSKRPRVCRHHAHMLKHMCPWFRCTRGGGRFESTHGPPSPPLPTLTPNTTPAQHHTETKRDRDREETEKERKEDERREKRRREEGGRESLATLRES